jgi:hypothetical protein
MFLYDWSLGIEGQDLLLKLRPCSKFLVSIGLPLTHFEMLPSE